MASIIRIKRSSVAGNPNTLAAGELAYSALTDNGSNGGDRLYIGIGVENSGNAANHFVIGGKYFTDMLDHNRGTLTANSAIVTDADNKIDDLKVDNLELNGNTLSSTDTDGNVLLDPNGTGYVQAVGTNVFVLPVGNTAQRVNDVQGAIRYNTELSSFEGYSGTNWGSLGGVKSVDGLTYITAESTPGESDDILSFVTNGTERLFIDTDSAEFDATVVVKVDNTTESTATTDGALVVAGGVGIAKDLRVAGNIYAANFTGTGSVSLGNINITDNTISSTNTNGDINIVPNGTGDVKLTADTTVVGDLDTDAIITTNGTGDLTLSTNSGTNSGTIKIEDGVDNHIILTPAGTGDVKLVADTTVVGDADANATITTNGTGDLTLSTNSGVNSGTITIPDGADANISIDPDGTGNITVNSARIINLADPVNPQDAATKNYVDDVAQGLAVKPAVKVATTENLTATYANGTNGVGATLTLDASDTLTIDGVSLTALYTGILVKNQTNAFENGRYYISQVGNLSEEWILTRCPKCDEASEIPSMYIFVQEGTANAATGWVAVVEDFGAFDVGVDDIVFYQFAGAGNYLAGDALAFGLDGRTFNVVVAATGGIEITDDALQLKSTVAGSGLTYSNGVISVGGTTDRITVSDDAIDIASTYVGQNTITTLGTIETGTWQGTIIDPTYGGTGVNNGTKTITLGGNLTTSGAFATTLTVTAETNVTLPTTGTLATLDGTETFTNKTLTSPTITGGSINNTPIGATTASTGRFTTVTITGTDASSSTATGALVVAGGLGVGEDIYVAQDIIGAGAATSDLDGFNIDGGTYVGV